MKGTFDYLFDHKLDTLFKEVDAAIVRNLGVI